MSDDKTFLEHLAAFKDVTKDDAPSEELYRRIITVAPGSRQLSAKRPFDVARSLQRFFGEWRYAMAVKCASLALVAVAGFFVGEGLGHETFFSSIVTGDISWED